MPDLVPPHGSTRKLVDRYVPAAEEAAFRSSLNSLVSLPVSDADLATVHRIADGALSPLTGFMNGETFHRVLNEEHILDHGLKFAWTIPLSLPVDASLAQSLKVGQKVALTDSKGNRFAELTVSDVFPWDKAAYVQGVYATNRWDHPGGRMVENDPRTHLVGGEIRVLHPQPNPHYGDLLLSPKQTRELFAKLGYKRVVAFQTRNPLHRAHEYALVVGLERLVREGHFAGAVLNPLVGETKGDDVDAVTRMKTYRALVDNKALGQGDCDEELWKKTGCPISDRIHLLGLDIKMFYAGPKEAIMHAIYRQNYGFTDIIIGRKHADAPYEDGKDIWDGLAAQRKFDELKGDLVIKPVKVGFAAFYEELGRVGLVEDWAAKGYKAVSISGRELREILRAGNLPDPRVMRPETARVLIEKMKA